MSEEDIYDVPEDLIEEVVEEEEKPRQEHRRRQYPSQKDIMEAVKTIALTYNVDPILFPEEVLRYLEEKGFNVKHVNFKRIWRTYEKLVRNGQMRDVLGVVWS
ncbi:MAG: hypothetical protein F7B60_06280 [Desulfurococcales archaeon]|nr:hypothetical protein [Desulfurococcales archaeon]